MRVKLEDLVNDSSIFPRGGVSDLQVQRLVQALELGVLLPAIVIEKKSKRIVDGWHRVEAYRRQGLNTIDTIAKSYASEADLYADAVRLNIAHGLALTSYHVRVAIARLEQSGFTREQISDVVKMTVEQIEKVERGFASNQAGEAVALKGGLRNLKGETLSAEQLEVNRRYSGPKAIFHVRQIIQLLRNDMWPRNEDFITEMNTLAEVWKELVTKENKAA